MKDCIMEVLKIAILPITYLFVVFLSACAFKYIAVYITDEVNSSDCRYYGEAMGVEAKKVGSGCYVNYKGNWIPRGVHVDIQKELVR